MHRTQQQAHLRAQRHHRGHTTRRRTRWRREQGPIACVYVVEHRCGSAHGVVSVRRGLHLRAAPPTERNQLRTHKTGAKNSGKEIQKNKQHEQKLACVTRLLTTAPAPRLCCTPESASAFQVNVFVLNENISDVAMSTYCVKQKRIVRKTKEQTKKKPQTKQTNEAYAASHAGIHEQRGVDGHTD